MADHALACAHVALGKVGPGGLHGRKDLLLPHGPVQDVIEGGIVALAHHRIERAHGHPLAVTAADHVLHQRIVDQAHVEGIGQGNGRFQGAQLLDLHKSRALSKAVEDKGGGGQLVDKGIFRTGKEDGHPRLMGGRVHRTVPHRDAGHIGDAVVGALGKRAHTQAVVGRTELMQGRFLLW